VRSPHKYTNYRPAIGAPGDAIVSTFGLTDPLDGSNPDAKPYYRAIPGTSMACPAAAGVCALIIDAARENGNYRTVVDSMDAVEATRTAAEDAGGQVVDIRTEESSLEEVFLNVAESGTRGTRYVGEDAT